jgi:hypothetical protein
MYTLYEDVKEFLPYPEWKSFVLYRSEKMFRTEAVEECLY